jgi:hypothetical protein
VRYVGDVQQLLPYDVMQVGWVFAWGLFFLIYISLGTPAKVGDVGRWDENVTDQKRGE